LLLILAHGVTRCRVPQAIRIFVENAGLREGLLDLSDSVSLDVNARVMVGVMPSPPMRSGLAHRVRFFLLPRH